MELPQDVVEALAEVRARIHAATGETLDDGECMRVVIRQHMDLVERIDALPRVVATACAQALAQGAGIEGHLPVTFAPGYSVVFIDGPQGRIGFNVAKCMKDSAIVDEPGAN